MSHRSFDRRPTASWFFTTGVVLFAVTFGVIAWLAPDFGAVPAAGMFLLLCIPAIAGLFFEDKPSPPDEWDLYGRTEMATLGALEVIDTDEFGEMSYAASAVLADGGTVRVENFRFSGADHVIVDRPLPVEYLPQTRRARVRMDLVTMVLDCEDPLRDH